MTETATSAVAQMEQMQTAISQIDAELTGAAHDGQRHAQLISRRSAMQRAAAVCRGARTPAARRGAPAGAA
jgi:hypothetical protein